MFVVADKYHVVRPLGQGGMGVVYDAIHAKTGRRVALKLIHETAITGGPAARKRFQREARAGGAVDSIHVVQVLDSGEDERSGLPFIVMEFLEGCDLRAALRYGPLPPETAVAIAIQTCLGLKKAHAAEIVHRDLKPGNIFLAQVDGDRRIAKMLDFGIAKLMDSAPETVDLTTTGDLVGSPPYMSPEQLRSPRDVDRRSDLWSLGVVLYEMLSGQTPTQGITPIGARVYAICHTPSPSIAKLVPGLPPSLVALVHRALAIDPSERFQDADAFLEALKRVFPASTEISEHVFAGRGGEASLGDRSAESVAGSATTRHDPLSAPLPHRRRRAMIVAGTAAASIAVVALASFGAWRATRHATPATLPEEPSPALSLPAEPSSSVSPPTLAPSASASDPAPSMPVAPSTMPSGRRLLPSGRGKRDAGAAPKATSNGRDQM